MALQLDYEPRFLEEAVRAALRDLPEARLFHRQRESIYSIADPEDRARAFTELDAEWYARLELARPLEQALAEQPLVVAGVGRCAVGRPPGARDAGAELLVRDPDAGGDPAAGRTLRLLFDPRALGDAEVLLRFLRREIQHVADMLDPAFGYSPRLEVAGGPAAQRAARDRYRAVWNAAVDGRLVRAGHLPASVREERREEIERAFGPGEEALATLAGAFDEPRPTHAAIAAAVAASLGRAARSRAMCPLCGCPTTTFAALGLEEQALAAIRADFPRWDASEGCCPQCADLYRARELSLREAALLPGIR